MDEFDNFEFEESEEDADELGFDNEFDSGFEDDFEDDTADESDGGGNRTFLLVAGILGAILILALACMAIYAFVIAPPRAAQQQTQIAEVNMQNTQVIEAADMTAQAEAWTPTITKTATEAPVTPTLTNTPVLAATQTAEGTTDPEVTADPRTATVAALLTQEAGKLTITPTATQLPDTGFADDVGIPGMLAMAAALVVVIFLARRLRSAAS